ncbi:basement membrane-specific heparan sulfate proteoglycan core protein-like [Zeugodacus cucurbitae]|uniref:basement membrane-specific heparan sulfate proteoglycan core protein-like n=1 Tax=Zeugodacus cucurbitae TaxID=28588 RepID=UPI0023D8E801|nr:basement membrane-specific heparan sulfate proteoglycan core protein-like [Zeugodacus cucurbitae]
MTHIKLPTTRKAKSATTVVAQRKMRTLCAKATSTAARITRRTKTTTATTTASMVAPPKHIMKIKRKSKIPEISLLIAALWINSFWPGSSDGGAYCAHMTAAAGVATGHTFTVEMRGAHHYDEGRVAGDGSSSSVENMQTHGFGHEGDAIGMLEESEERDHIAHHFEMKNHEDMLDDIRDDAAGNFIPEKDLPKFGEPLHNVTIPVGREAVMQCVVDNLQTYKIAWLRVDTQTILTIQNHVITKNHRMSITHAEKRAWILRIRDVKEADKGWYMCQINTDPMKSQVVYLDVVVPPDILDYPTSTDMVVQEGSNVTLKCAAVGSPTPTITWRREGGEPIPLPNNTEVIAYNASHLTITKVQRRNMGAYLCIASNGIPPSVSKRVMLIVHFPPMIWIQNQLVGAATGQNITLECQSEAYPKSINYWTKNETIIVPGDHFTSEIIENGYRIIMRLTINDVNVVDFGSYRCVAKNSLGDTDGTIKLYHIPQTTTVTTIAPTVALNTVPVVIAKDNNKDQHFSKKVHRTKSNAADISSSSMNNAYIDATSSLWNSQDHSTGREQQQFSPCELATTSNVLCEKNQAGQLVSTSMDPSSGFSSSQHPHLYTIWLLLLAPGLHILLRRRQHCHAIQNIA